jgi:O-antigen/teichoic acid export membrane protein
VESRSDSTARSIVLLVVQHGITILGGILFVVIVPRLMGPATYGRYALMTSLAMWCAVISGLGMLHLIARYVPGLTVRDPARLNTFLGNLLTLRLLSGAVTAALYGAVTVVWLKDQAIDALLLLAGSILVRAVANFVFTTFLGFNRPGYWLAEDSLRRWLSLALIVPAFSVGGLTGACAAVLGTEVLLLAFGAWAARSWLAGIDVRLDLGALAPYFRLGLAFYATQLLSTALYASGEPLVRSVSGDYAEVAYFALAHAMYLPAVVALPQLTFLFVPLLSESLARGEAGGYRRSVERLLAWLMVGGVVVVLASLLVGERVVALLLGDGYSPVAANLVPLSAALLVFAFASVTSALALVHERPQPIVTAAGLRLLVFWSMGPPLVAHHGAWGCALAAAVAAAAHAGWLAWSMRRSLAGTLRLPLMAVAFGALFLPLVWLRASAVTDLLLFLAFAAAYGALLFRAGVLTRAEIKALVDAISAGRAKAGAAHSRAPAVL